MVKVFPPLAPVNWVDRVENVAGWVPKSSVPKLMPFCVGEPLIKQPFVSVSVAPIVPLLVTASA
ncbi:Uncharacterised protein [Enterobacter cloacae]|nr:Uncharacterised protein [Enterobacter cloacae]